MTDKIKMPNTYFISDLHFGHKNCLALDNRPFKTIEEHDEEIIRRWNEKVGIDEDVWILGDVSWYNVTKTIELIERLNGNKHLCIGNHDKNFLKNKDFRDLFVDIQHYKELDVNGKLVVLSHYPIPCFNNHYYGAYHLYGHVHTGWEWNMMERNRYENIALYDKPCNMYNVGCMVPYMQFTPQTLDEIVREYEVYKTIGESYKKVKKKE